MPFPLPLFPYSPSTNPRSFFNMKSNSLFAWGSAQLFFVLGVLVAVVFGILSNEIAKTLGLGASDIGLLGGAFLITYALSQLVLGILIGKIPARLVLGPAAIVSGLGAFFFSISGGFVSALAAQIVLGIGLGSTFVGVIYLVGRRYGASFAFMSSLSQSLANIFAASLAISSAFAPILVDFRFPFQLLGILFLVSAALIFVFVTDRPEAQQGEELSLGAALKIAVGSGQFWAALVFYCGTFGTLLAFANLWNIQFQLNFFSHSVQQSAVMNSMISLGATVGGLSAGWWAGKSGFVLPARTCVSLALACFVLLLVAPLPDFVAGAVLFFVGCGFGSSTLGLAVLQKHLPGPAIPLATSMVVTAACIFGGIIQPLVGWAVGTPHRAADLFALIYRSSNPDFDTYQSGLILLLVSVLAATVASFFFRKAQAS